MNNKKTEEEIIKLKKLVNKYNEIEPTLQVNGKELAELRNLVLNTHFHIELTLESLIMLGLMQVVSFSGEKSIIIMMTRLFKVIEKIDFSKKSIIAKEINQLSQPTFNLFMKINTLRVEFAHPASSQLEKYNEDRQKYLASLKLLLEGDRQAEIVGQRFFDFLKLLIPK